MCRFVSFFYLGKLIAYSRFMNRISPSQVVSWRMYEQDEVDEQLCNLHGSNQRADAYDVDDPLDIIGQYMQGKLGADPI